MLSPQAVVKAEGEELRGCVTYLRRVDSGEIDYFV